MYKKYLALLLALGTVMISAAACKDTGDIEEQTGNSIGQTETEAAPEESGFPKLEVLSDKEDSNWVQVETTYGTFRYPAAFSDIIKVNTVTEKESAQLQVMLLTGEVELAVYTLYYNYEGNDAAIPCGKLKLTDESEEMTVSVVFENAPESLSADWLSTFYAVQETFNNVIVSMAEDSRFVAAE